MAPDASATGTSRQHDEGWALIGPDGVLISADPVFCALFGLAAHDPASEGLRGRPWRAVAPRGVEGLVDDVVHGARYGLPWRGDVRIEDGSRGRLVHVEGTAAHRTVVLRVSAPARDGVTIEGLAPTVDQLALERLAHELNNPLTAIAGYARAFSSLPPAEQARALAVIEAEALRAGNVVRALLEAARRDAAVPTEARPAAESPPQATIEQPAASRPRVLVVDDEVAIRDLATQLLATAGYDAVAAPSAEDALALLDARSFDAMITDIRMPGMDGIALHAEVARRWPDLARRTVIISGDTHAEAVASLVRHAGLPALEKPFRLDALLGALAEVLARP